MKWIINLIAGLLAPVYCLAGDGYVIKGKVTGIVSGYVTILEIPENPEALHETLPERVRIVDGEFSISGKVKQPGLVNLKVSTKTIRLFLENTDYTVNTSLQELNSTHFTGSALNNQYNDFLKSETSPLAYATAHPEQLISGYLVQVFAREYQELQKGYAPLSLEVKGSVFGQAIWKKLEAFKTTEAGKDMPDFTMTAPDGKTFSIKSLAGKVVVLDFWASWCGPCREFIPTMRQYYQQYHPKGVEFVAVSFDEHTDKWKKAMEETGMEWKQGIVEGGFGPGAPVKNLLNINSIPHVIIIGKDGKIAAWLNFYMKSRIPDILEKL